MAAPIPTAVTTGKRWVPSQKKKNIVSTASKEEEDGIDQQLQASWIALQRKEREYNELKERVSDSDEDEDTGEDSSRLVDFLRKHEPGGELDETGFVEVVDELGRTRLMKRDVAEKKNLVKSGYCCVCQFTDL
jgi:hypothetical protein